ncbi:MAG: tripartite tricarboxylate transporter substrate binding protein [Pseudomonadota bacterium]
MTHLHKRRAVVALLSLTAMGLAAAQSGGAYPNKPIRLVVPFAPAGPTDIAARLIARKLSESLGQPVVIDNKPGAGGTVGSAEVARAAADGYTLLYGSSSTLSVSPALYAKLSYDAAKAFEPVGLVARGPQIVVIHGALPISNLKEFVDYAKKAPNGLSYSSAGNGSVGHLSAELLINSLGIKATHIPYKGGAPAINAVVSGETQFTIDAIGTTSAFIKAGRLKAVAVISDKRTGFMPELPTTKEAGFTAITADFWSGIVAPAGTPQPVIDRLNREIVKALKEAEVEAQLKNLGAEAQGSSPAEFTRLIQEESKKWAEVVVKSGAKAE